MNQKREKKEIEPDSEAVDEAPAEAVNEEPLAESDKENE